MRGAGLAAYRQTIEVTTSGRDLEAAVLTKAAHLLRNCQAHWGEAGCDTRLNEALRYNQKIWTVFQAELVRDDNPLPLELRENILSLSIFVDRRIIDVMAQPDPEKLNILIDINLNLAAGLRANPTSQ